MITQPELMERLNYDPETGVFTWRWARNPKYIGRPTGSVQRNGKGAGYVIVVIDKREYMGHRLAWLYVYGRMPNGPLDHINRVKHDNRIVNLREATPRQNAANTEAPAHNTSGYKGVSWRKRTNKWYASITILDRSFHLGSFDTAEEAAAEYDRFAAHLHGEFFYKNGCQA